MLDTNAKERLSSALLKETRWASMQPVSRPRGYVPQKYTIENCLPQLFHSAHSHMSDPGVPSEAFGQRFVITAPYPTLQPMVEGGAMQPSYQFTSSDGVMTYAHHQPVAYANPNRRSTYTPRAAPNATEGASSLNSISQPHHQVTQRGAPRLHSHAHSHLEQ